MDWFILITLVVVLVIVIYLIIRAGKRARKSNNKNQPGKKLVVDGLLMRATGNNGSVELYENKVRIKRSGLNSFLAQGMKGDKDIYINQISSIQLKKPSGLIKGYIQFAFLGGKEAKGGLSEAWYDENTVMIDGYQFNDFEIIKQAIEKKLFPDKTKTSSNLDDLEKLADLKNKGIITEEEFELKKKQLLGL